MSKITIDSVCTKGNIYPTLLYFQNGSPAENFETNCAVLQDKNRNRMVVMENSGLVYAGKEEKEGSEQTVILARDRITGKVRLIEVSTVDLKPLTQTDLDNLPQQDLKQGKTKSKNTKTQMQNSNMDTGQIITNNATDCRDIPVCNSPVDFCVPPIDREITKDELEYLQQQQVISRLQFIEFEKKKREETNEVSLEPVPEKMEIETSAVKKPVLRVFDNNFSEEFHVPPINRKAKKIRDVYSVEKVLTEDEFGKIYQELEENNYTTDLHPYIKCFVHFKNLSPELTVLAVYASELIKYLHVSQEEIRKKNFSICRHSKTLNGILMKNFTKLVVCTLPNKVCVIRIRSKDIQDKVICHIMVFMFLLNNYQFYLEPLRVAMNMPKNRCINRTVGLCGGLVSYGKYGKIIKLRLRSVRRELGWKIDRTSHEYLESVTQHCENRSKLVKQPLPSEEQDIDTEQKEKDRSDLNNFYLPPLNRNATKLENVYPIENILSQEEYEQIYYELEESDYTGDLHPYMLPFIENRSLSVQLTVIAMYASKLIQLLQINQNEVMKSDFKLCEHSKTLNDIIMKGFTKYHLYKGFIKRRKVQEMNDKILCHIIIFTLILNNFKIRLMLLLDIIEVCDRNQIMKVLETIGASIIQEDGEEIVQLLLLKVTKSKPHIDSTPVQQEDSDGYKIDADEFYVPFINREATTLEDVYPLYKIFSEDDFYQIYFEVVENYLERLHPCIKSIVETRSLSLECIVLAVYASELLKFVHINKPHRNRIINKIQIMCQQSQKLNDILIERFLLKQNAYQKISGKKAIDMRYKGVCHIIVCMLILSNYKFKIDPLLDAMKNRCNPRNTQKMVNLVGASIVAGDNGAMVQLKLPLVAKTQVTIKQPSLIDPDDFYVPYINREASKVDDVYLAENIFSEDEYELIYSEIVKNNYKDNLHPYIQSIVESKVLSLKLIVLATLASELIHFLSVYHIRIWKVYFKITRLSRTLDGILKKRFLDEKRIFNNVTQDMKEKMLCNIIVCNLILNNFQFKLEPLCSVVIMYNMPCSISYMEKMVSLVGASIVDGDDGPIVELKLPLVPKNLDNKNLITSDFENEKTGLENAIVNNDNQQNISENNTNPENSYLPPSDLEITNIKDAYPIESFLSKDKCETIYRELEETNYNFTKDLHPYILSLVDINVLSLELKVLAVYASELLKFLLISWYEIKKSDFRICQNSDTLNNILMKGFTTFVEQPVRKRIIRMRPKYMKDKVVCHVIIFILILHNYKFKLEPLCNAINPNNKRYGSKNVKQMVGLVGASLVEEDGEPMVELKLPLARKNLYNKNQLTSDIEDTPQNDDSGLGTAILSDDSQQDIPEEIADQEDYYLPSADLKISDIKNVYTVHRFLSQDKCEMIYQELEESKYDFANDLHPYIQSLVDINILSLELRVLAVYASELLKFLHISWYDILKSDFKICQDSETLNNILMKGFTTFVERGVAKRVIRTRPKYMKDKLVCHVIVFILILNNFKFKLEPLCNAINAFANNNAYGTNNILKMVSRVRASIVQEDDRQVVKIKLPSVPKTEDNNGYPCTFNFGDALGQMKKRVGKYPLIINRSVNEQDISGNIENIADQNDCYIPPADLEATNIKDVYPVDRFLSKDKRDKIYRELEKNDYNIEKDLHPYIQSFVDMSNFSPELVLAVYASELLKFFHKKSREINKNYLRLCHKSDTLNDILLKDFTKVVITDNVSFLRKRPNNMKDKSVCHLIVCILILNNFKFKLKPFCDTLNSINKPYGSKNILKMVNIVGASIVGEDDGPTVQLKLPLVPNRHDDVRITRSM